MWESIRALCCDRSVVNPGELPPPPILGEQEIHSPQNWGLEVVYRLLPMSDEGCPVVGVGEVLGGFCRIRT